MQYGVSQYFFPVLSFPFLSLQRFWCLAGLLPANPVEANIYSISDAGLLSFSLHLTTIH